MGKRQFKKYVQELPKGALQEQVLDLYERFPVVKEYYDFIFNPREDKLVQEAKTKISNEYFPTKRKRPKARRSVAQKLIKHFLKLGVAPNLIADVMLFNLEIAQLFAKERNVPDAFYKSMLNSFNEAVQFVAYHNLLTEHKHRIIKVYRETQSQGWPLASGFSQALDVLD